MYSIEVYLAVRQFVFVDGHSRNEAARVFGLHKSTVQKMCAHPKPPQYRRPKYTMRILGPYVEIIQSILREDEAAPKKQRHTVRRIVDRLRKEHNYGGSYAAVTKYLRKTRPTIRKVGVPLTHPPGNAQVDFGESTAIVGSIRQKVHLFCMIFPYSDAPFIKAYPNETTTAFIDGHISAFNFFGKVPRNILYDNTRLAVARIERGGVRKRTKAFSELVSHYLFKDSFCGVGGAQHKAKVEQLVGYSRRNFMTPIPIVNDFDALNLKLELDCVNRQTRRIGRALRTIGERLVEDLRSCRDLPREALDATKTKRCRVTSSSLVHFEGNEYSVPTSYVGWQVEVHARLSDLSILASDEVVAHHRRSFKHGVVVYDPLHYLALLEARPGALDQAAPLKGWLLPFPLRQVRGVLETALGEAGKREYIRVLRLLETFEMAHVVAGVRDALNMGLLSCEAVKKFTVARIERRTIRPSVLRRLQKSLAQSKYRPALPYPSPGGN